MTQRKLRLGAFIMATGHHIAAWRSPGSQADAGINIDHYIALAKAAGRGLFDQVLVADSPGIKHTGDEESFSRQGRMSHFEPVTLWAVMQRAIRRDRRSHGAAPRRRARGEMAAGSQRSRRNQRTGSDGPAGASGGANKSQLAMNRAAMAGPMTNPVRPNRAMPPRVEMSTT